MGLLEKAQQRKDAVGKTKGLEEKRTTEKFLANVQQRKDGFQKTKAIEQKSTTVGLLEKIQQQKEELQKTEDLGESIIEEAVEEPEQRKPVYAEVPVQQEERNVDVVDEKKGFGWKGLGSRRIVFDHDINEYIYEVSEPVLNEDELKTKNELVHLFKMLADVNVSGMDKEEKKKYLEETLEQIIIDNDVKFYVDNQEEASQSSGMGFAFLRGKNKEKKAKEVADKNNSVGKTFSFRTMGKKTKNKKTKINIEEEKTELDEEEKKAKDNIFYHLFREFIGYGKIDILMEDDGIEDISCDGHHVPIFLYHKKYEEVTTNIHFDDADDLDSFVVRLSQICGKQISIYSPIVDGKLPDGSRLQTTLSKTVTRESTFTIRRFRENPLTPIDLINFNSMSTEMAAYFWMAIENGASILFCGGTASGKTSALNALSLFIPAAHKIISIEDTREVNLPHKNWIAGTTRQGFSSSEENKTGKDIDMFDLIRAALRQRPRVVIVGEVRGREAYSLFQAMATGHTSYATIHASTIHTLIQRLENPPITLPRALLTSLDIIVFQNAVNISGKTVRRMTSITEVIKLDPDTNQLIFMEPFSWVSKTDDRFESSGSSKVLSNIRQENDWTEEQLNKELENRVIILKWMKKKNIRDYREVGRIASDYHKYPELVLKKAKGAMKK